MTFVPVLTRSYDNARSGANLAESILTPQAVGKRGIARLFSLAIPDDPRIDAQPLIIPEILMADGLTHDLCIVCSMANRVYCFDANSGEVIWVQRIGTGINNSRSLDSYLINVHWGCLSTPVIDLDSHSLYVCNWSSPDGTPNNARFWMHAMRLEDGSSASKTIDLGGVSFTPPNGIPKIQFGATARKQRSGLLLTAVNGVKTIFVPFGSVSESLNSARGWLIAIGTDPFEVTATWCSTSRFSGAGIWQGGQGPAADKDGNIYLITGNGAFDNITDFGEAFVKLAYSTPKISSSGSIKPIDWWSPFSDAGRYGEPQNQPQITISAADVADRPSNTNEWTDMDLGSAGPLLIPTLNLLLGAGKDGIAYVMDSGNLGKTMLSDFANPTVNYQKLKSPPVWFTFFPGWNQSPQPLRFTDLNINYFNATHHLHGTAVHYKSARYGEMIFCWGENGNLRAWAIDSRGIWTYLANSDEVASPAAQVPPGGMPGGMLTLSANGDTGAILWALVPVGDANKQITDGILLAYDAENFSKRPDGSQRLNVLWRSDQWGLAFSHPKFNLPVVSGGRVFVPTYSGRVDVYGIA
jgi:hypothetical protein